MNPTSHILNELQAETMLEGSHVLEQITALRKGLRYQTNGETVSFDDFFAKMQGEVGTLPRMTLENSVAPGTEAQYQVQLVTALEKIFDDADRVLNRLLFFQSKLRAALQQANVLEVTFIAWYSIAVAEALENYKAIKLNATVIKALAQAEFGRLMEGVHIDLETLMEATKILAKQIQSHKTLAQEKYNLGKDQVNASWTSQNLPSEAVADSDGASALIETPEEPEEEDNTSVPEFVSRETRLGPGTERIAEVEAQNAEAVEQIVEAAQISLAQTHNTRTDRNGRTWVYCDMCHNLMCPWCYPKKNWVEDNSYQEPTVAELPHIEDPVEAVAASEEGPVVTNGGSTVIGLPTTQHFPEEPVSEDWKGFIVAGAAEPTFVGTVDPYRDEQPAVEMDIPEGATLEPAVLSADSLTLMLGDHVKVTATNADGQPIAFAPSVTEKKERKHKAALEFVSPTETSQLVPRAADGVQAEKIKCLVCDRRIRVGQLMFERDGEWAHAQEADCTAKPPRGTLVPEVQGTVVAAVNTRADVAAETQPEIKGTFVKHGDPAPVIEVEPGADAATILQSLEATAAAVKPPRKKLEILSEEADVL